MTKIKRHITTCLLVAHSHFCLSTWLFTSTGRMQLFLRKDTTSKYSNNNTNKKCGRRVRPIRYVTSPPASNDTGTALGEDGSDWSRDLATMTFELLTLKLVRESHQRWETFLPNLGMLGLWVFELFAVYATDGRTDRRTEKSNASLPAGA